MNKGGSGQREQAELCKPLVVSYLLTSHLSTKSQVQSQKTWKHIPLWVELLNYLEKGKAIRQGEDLGPVIQSTTVQQISRTKFRAWPIAELIE